MGRPRGAGQTAACSPRCRTQTQRPLRGEQTRVRSDLSSPAVFSQVNTRRPAADLPAPRAGVRVPGPTLFLFLMPPAKEGDTEALTAPSGGIVGSCPRESHRRPRERAVRRPEHRPGVTHMLCNGHSRLMEDKLRGEDVLPSATLLIKITRRSQWAARRSGSPPTPLPASAALNYDFRHRQPHRHSSLKGR